MVKCEHCGGTMSLRTGKSGKYRYYGCLKQAKEGKSGCKGCSVPMPALGEAGTNAPCSQVIQPDRLSELFHEIQAGVAQNGHTIRQERV